MQHNQNTKNNVRRFRTNGLSLGQIWEKTGVPKTTIRSWIKDIKLSQRQLDELKSKTQKALQKGRIRKQKKTTPRTYVNIGIIFYAIYFAGIPRKNNSGNICATR